MQWWNRVTDGAIAMSSMLKTRMTGMTVKAVIGTLLRAGDGDGS